MNGAEELVPDLPESPADGLTCLSTPQADGRAVLWVIPHFIIIKAFHEIFHGSQHVEVPPKIA